MGRKKVYAMIASIIAVAAVALLLGFVVVPGSSTNTETTADASIPRSPSEGITIHGYWMVDVLNPDGTLAEHREFENSVSPEAKTFLTSLLGRTRTMGRWYIMVDGSPAHPCMNSSSPDVCYVCESNTPISYSSYFKNMEMALGDAYIELSGSITIANTTSITFVSTIIEYCSCALSPISCGDSTTINDERQMTSTGVSPAIAVQEGQQVLVTVRISFS